MALEAVTLLALLPTALSAAECTDRFPEGRYGIPLTHSAIAFVKPTLDGFSPLYVQKLPVAIATPADCEYVYTVDVFRLVESPTALFAGCIGDFDGDGQPDVALLRKRQRDGRVLPVVFRSQGARYDITLIDHITDPYGFNENASVWPGSPRSTFHQSPSLTRFGPSSIDALDRTEAARRRRSRSSRRPIN